MAMGAWLMVLAEVMVGVALYISFNVPKRWYDFRTSDWVAYAVAIVLGAGGAILGGYALTGGFD